jgi:hypothetical protein
MIHKLKYVRFKLHILMVKNALTVKDLLFHFLIFKQKNVQDVHLIQLIILNKKDAWLLMLLHLKQFLLLQTQQQLKINFKILNQYQCQQFLLEINI